ncbi:MAG: anhydro-N-acetylmuramic acid kinase [Halomonadaceae bacterium]|nr:MAG: anhydro-N-acetylmuramic acid kinase [Halomonadaceae bacterium]
MPSQPPSTLYIGLMSGTSMDGTDAVLVDLNTQPPQTLSHFHAPYPPATLALLEQLVNNCGTPHDIGETDTRVGEHFANCVLALLAQHQLPATAVRAIGSHGQTIRHEPESHTSFTLQLGDPNVIAEKTSIDVIADFRRRDMAAGGQGAPLAPAFHHWCFNHSGEDRAIVNIGGMANLTWLPAEGDVLGCDTGPGNRLMDLWCQLHQGQPYDGNGDWAASGQVIPELLQAMLADNFFQRCGPRSTGREYFNEQWLTAHLRQLPSLAVEDVQRTLLALTATTIAQSLSQAGKPQALYICGGGAYNLALMRELETLVSPCVVLSTESLGLGPQAVEGAAFAWLAMRHLQQLPGNLPAVTGARGYRVLGGLYPGKTTDT